mgnify:CR=1 FL=1
MEHTNTRKRSGSPISGPSGRGRVSDLPYRSPTTSPSSSPSSATRKRTHTTTSSLISSPQSSRDIQIDVASLRRRHAMEYAPIAEKSLKDAAKRRYLASSGLSSDQFDTVYDEFTTGK